MINDKNVIDVDEIISGLEQGSDNALTSLFQAKAVMIHLENDVVPVDKLSLKWNGKVKLSLKYIDPISGESVQLKLKGEQLKPVKNEVGVATFCVGDQSFGLSVAEIDK